MKLPSINFRKLAKVTKAFLVDHSADILTGFTAAGVLITAIETHRATKKAEEYLAINGYSQANEQTQKYLRWESNKNYILPAACGTATIAAAIGANYINHKQIAALAAACSVAETALSDYRGKVEEVLGTKNFSKVENRILEEEGHKAMALASPAYNTGKGTILCVDGMTGIRYYASEDWIDHCRNVYNERVNQDTYCSYGEYLEIVLDGCNPFIPKDMYDKGYNIHINGLLNFREPHWEGEKGEEPYMIYKPYVDPVTNYTNII